MGEVYVELCDYTYYFLLTALFSEMRCYYSGFET